MNMTRILLAFLSMLIGTHVARAAPAPLVVVELFTSQGCSSCPPADALLAELAGRADILPLAFHVTYWNGLGWQDPFSFEAATERQRSYQHLLRTETIYTPQIVVGGVTETVGSNRQAVAALLARRQPADDTMLSISRLAGTLKIDVGAGSGTAQVILIGFDGARQTRVSRGENAGRLLSEVNIVRGVVPLTEWTGSPLTLSSAVVPGERTAVILQERSGRIVAAAVTPPG